jgi:type VI secretion system protein ImpH
LLYYGGLLAHRPRNAHGLGALLRDYFNVPVAVEQFQGQWLLLEPWNRTSLGEEGRNNLLGVNTLAGEHVWDIQGKFRIRVGPVPLARFNQLLPNAEGGRLEFFLFSQLTRLYAGSELDFEVRLVLRADEVPECQLPEGDDNGPALGWNSWLRSDPFEHDAEDAVFPGQPLTRVDELALL